MKTRRIYKIDPENWEVLNEWDAPGLPFGIVAFNGELRVLCGETEEDFRIIRRFTEEQGFDPEFKIPCPNDTGSQLGYNGEHLHVSQWYDQRVLQLDSRAM